MRSAEHGGSIYVGDVDGVAEESFCIGSGLQVLTALHRDFCSDISGGETIGDGISDGRDHVAATVEIALQLINDQVPFGIDVEDQLFQGAGRGVFIAEVDLECRYISVVVSERQRIRQRKINGFFLVDRICHGRTVVLDNACVGFLSRHDAELTGRRRRRSGKDSLQALYRVGRKIIDQVNADARHTMTVVVEQITFAVREESAGVTGVGIVAGSKEGGNRIDTAGAGKIQYHVLR